MTLEEAETHLKAAKFLSEDGKLYCLSPWVSESQYNWLTLDGDFSAGDLEALAVWKRAQG